MSYNLYYIWYGKVGVFPGYLKLLFTIPDLALQARHKSCKLKAGKVFMLA
jgi:hypothetical protein